MADAGIRDDSENAAFKGWSECAKAMRHYDESLVKGWKEEIDTLLVFAGLFSAVLTAFTLESYKLLQQDQEKTSADLLRLLVTQVVAISAQPGSRNVSIPNMATPVFEAPASAVRINAFWFSSLVCSLISALLGILVKQWLREYLQFGLTSPRDLVRMRQFRFVGLVSWRVPDIVATLPLLLQIALVLFLVGLLDLLWTLHTIIASVTTVIVALSLTLISVTVFVPFFSPNCPYKSPFALRIHSIARSFEPMALARKLSSPRPDDHAIAPTESWWDRDVRSAGYHTDTAAEAADQKALAWTHETLRDDDFLDRLAPCVAELSPRTRASFMLTELAARAALAPGALLSRIRRGPQAASDALYPALAQGHRGVARMLALVLDVLPEVPSHLDAGAGAAGALGRAELLSVLHPLLNAYVLTGRQHGSTRDALVRRAFGALVALVDYEGEPAATAALTFGALLAFEHLFWAHATPDDVARLVAFTLRGRFINDGKLLIKPTPFTLTRGRSCVLVSAAAAALHYLPALSQEQRATPDLHAGVESLLTLMEAHVRASNARGYTYARDAGPRTSWCWELCRVAQSERGLVHEGLVVALEEAALRGHIAPSEEGALRRLRYIVGPPSDSPEKSLSDLAAPGGETAKPRPLSALCTSGPSLTGSTLSVSPTVGAAVEDHNAEPFSDSPHGSLMDPPPHRFDGHPRQRYDTLALPAGVTPSKGENRDQSAASLALPVSSPSRGERPDGYPLYPIAVEDPLKRSSTLLASTPLLTRTPRSPDSSHSPV